MKTSQLADLLGLKSDMSAYFAHAPAEYFNLLGLRNVVSHSDEDGAYEFMHAFFDELEQLKSSFGILASKLSDNGVMWISVQKNNIKIKAADIQELAMIHKMDVSEVVEFDKWVAYKINILP